LGEQTAKPLAARLLNHTPIPASNTRLNAEAEPVPELQCGQDIYQERFLPDGVLDNTRLAILADALEEARCTNQDVLS
jgi:hypothetical protein